jgi:phospholipid/cholesterol/gamma-HCH transport system substrate-binding protein
MPAKPFKFRHVNEIAGAFALTVAVLLTGLIFISGHLQGWFEGKRLYDVVLPESGTSGIRPGAEVRILGARAGSVRSVELRDKRTGRPPVKRDMDPKRLQLVAVLELRGDYTVFVGEESKAALKTGLGGLGAAYIEVSRGDTPAPDLTVLPLADASSGSQKEMTDMVSELNDAMVPAIKQLEKTSRQIEILAETLNNPQKDFQIAIAGIRELLDEVKKGESVAGVLLQDEETGKEVRESLAKFNEATASFASVMAQIEKGEGAAGVLLNDQEAQQQIKQTLDNVSRASKSANDAALALTKAAGTLPATVNQADDAIQSYGDVADTLQETAREYEIAAEALQRHWLLRRFVRRDENPVAVARGQSPPPSAPTPATVQATDKSRTGLRALFQGKDKQEPDKATASSKSKPAPGVGMRK